MARYNPLPGDILLGQRVYFLNNPQLMTAQTYFQELAGFVQSLSDCNLPRTRHAAEQLGNINIIYTDRRTGVINAEGVTYFKATMEPIFRILNAEGGEKELIAITTGAVAQELLTLPSTVTLNDTQKHLLDETILCLQAGAYRAVVVMGWNLVYDFIRQRVFDNQLLSFNQALATHLDRNGHPSRCKLFRSRLDSPDQVAECRLVA